jgi:hypothetical protein
MKDNTGLEVPFLWPLSLPLTTAGPWAESRRDGEEAPCHGVHLRPLESTGFVSGACSLCQHPPGDLVSGELRSPLVKNLESWKANRISKLFRKRRGQRIRRGHLRRDTVTSPPRSAEHFLHTLRSNAVPYFGISKQCCSIQPGNSLERERTRPTRGGLCSLRSGWGSTVLFSNLGCKLSLADFWSGWELPRKRKLPSTGFLSRFFSPFFHLRGP